MHPPKVDGLTGLTGVFSASLVSCSCTSWIHVDVCGEHRAYGVSGAHRSRFLGALVSRVFSVLVAQTSYSLNSLKGGYIQDYIGDYFRAYYGGY